MKNIVIFGAPGSGKGTQSDLLIEHYGLEHISTGDVLRNEIKNGTELGKTAQGFIDNGQLIPDDLMVSILAKKYDEFGRARSARHRQRQTNHPYVSRADHGYRSC